MSNFWRTDTSWVHKVQWFVDFCQNLCFLIPRQLVGQNIGTYSHKYLLTYTLMHKSKSVLFNVTYWLSYRRHPVWMLRVCSTSQYKISTSTLFPSHRHTSMRWKSQHIVPYFSTNHKKSLVRVVLWLIGRYGEGWNFNVRSYDTTMKIVQMS